MGSLRNWQPAKSPSRQAKGVVGIFQPAPFVEEGHRSWPTAVQRLLRRCRKIGAALLAFALCSPSAFAEVMDKEPSLAAIWVGSMAVALTSFAAASQRPWLLLFIVPIPLALLTGLFMELTDPQVGPAILREAGVLYIASSVLGPLCVVGGVAAGFRLRWRRAQKATTS